MSLGENINKTPQLLFHRHFLIVPTFNPERRHSWGHAISHLSTQNSDIASSAPISNSDSSR
jgi:hypothetical protein